MKTYSKITFSVIFIISVVSTITPDVNAFSCNATSISSEPNHQFIHRVCSDGKGGALITWTDNRSGLGYDIYAQKINVSGSKEWGPSGIAISTEEGDQRSSWICNDGNGGAIIAWRNESNGIICAQRINANGSLLWNASGVLISTRGYGLKICRDNFGGAIIAWDYLKDFYAQRVSSNGTIMWDIDGVVICNATHMQENLQFFCDENGNSFFTWDDYRKGEIGGGYWDSDIFSQKVDINGIVQWQPNGTEICIADDYQWNPQICTDGVEGAIINWVDLRNNTCNAQRINSTGDSQWGSNGTIIANYVDWLSYSAMRSDNEGGAIIAVKIFPGSLYAVKVNSSGNILYITRLYATNTNYFSGSEMCSDGEGGTFITWTIGIPPPQSGAYTYDILAQYIDSNGKIFWPETGRVICNAPGDQVSVSLCSYGVDKAFISWEDNFPSLTSTNDVNIYYTVLEKRREEGTINFGNFYLLFVFLALLALVIVSRRRILQSH